MAHCRQCGSEIKNENGTPNFKRQFCPSPASCAKDFKRDAQRASRAKAKERGRCGNCNQLILPPEVWKEIKALAAKAGVAL